MSTLSIRLVCRLAAAAGFLLSATWLLAPAGALAQAAPASHVETVGASTCLTCHDTIAKDFGKTIHARVLNEENGRTDLMQLGCEACHGPGGEHVAAGGGRQGIRNFRHETEEAREDQNATCLTCHSKGREHWGGSAHDSADLACTNCHVIHKNLSGTHQLAKKTELELCTSCHVIPKAQLFRNAHMPVREGTMTCTSCHQPHGSTADAMLRHDTVNEQCTSCHADKRGPFLWEHPPVSEDCLNCHQPHGSTRHAMLKVEPPHLCQQCHIATLHPSQPRSPTEHFAIGRSCVQCHANIHGSNHPSGAFFTR